jgi:hypothetical protein
MHRREVESLLLSWGWESLGEYVYGLGHYRIDVSAWHKQSGFAVKGDQRTEYLWVSEMDLKHNIAVKFFMTRCQYFMSKTA